jgi:hypothetical protein
MRQRLRKLIGTAVLALFIPVYAMFVMTIAVAKLPGTGTLTQTLFFLVGGLLWVLPAGWIIRWMQRADSGPADSP